MIYFEAEFRNLNGTLKDPADPTWTIVDGRGNAVDNGGLKK